VKVALLSGLLSASQMAGTVAVRSISYSGPRIRRPADFIQVQRLQPRVRAPGNCHHSAIAARRRECHCQGRQQDRYGSNHESSSLGVRPGQPPDASSGL